MTTKLELMNRVLDSAHERHIQSSTQPIGNTLASCISRALQEVSATADWINTRRRGVAASWSTNTATISTTVEDVRVTAVKTRVAADANYQLAGNIRQEEIDAKLVTSFNGTNDLVDYWSYGLGSEQVKCTPYPADDDAKALVIFDSQFTITQPATDSTEYTIPQSLVTLAEFRANAIFNLKYLGDETAYQVWDFEYRKLRRQLIAAEQGTRPYAKDRPQQPQQQVQQPRQQVQQ
jgi:hypothetical protein